MALNQSRLKDVAFNVYRFLSHRPGPFTRLSCRHFRTPLFEGKCYCMDCGRGLLVSWQVSRCAHCRRLVPRDASHCGGCGGCSFKREPLENPHGYQLRHAWLVVRQEPREKSAEGFETHVDVLINDLLDRINLGLNRLLLGIHTAQL